MELCLIPGGEHRSTMSKFRPHINRKKIAYRVTFTNDCIYNLGDADQYDANKLFGLSYGFHHKNSIRIGWRWNLGYEKIEIVAYSYVGKIRRIGEMVALLDIGEPWDLSITTDANTYHIIAKRSYFSKGENHWVGKHKKLPFWGYELYPYFGGNKVAPHDMTIYMERL